MNMDIPPFTIASGRPARVVGLNVVGLRRAGLSGERRRVIKRAFDILYRSGMERSRALEVVRRELSGPEVDEIVRFFETSERGVARFAREEG